MKLVHGYTLRELLDYRERYDLSQLMEVIVQILHALTYAHSRGVVHRDIKPDNILVGPYGEVLLLDWGLAKVWRQHPHDNTNTTEVLPSSTSMNHDDNLKTDRSMTGEGKLQGTLMYMSPEQLNRSPDINLHADIYSIGVLLYEIISGVTPFQGTHVQTLVNQIKEDMPAAPISKLPIKAPPELIILCMQCLAKSPEDRPESAEELLRQLRDIELTA